MCSGSRDHTLLGPVLTCILVGASIAIPLTLLLLVCYDPLIKPVFACAGRCKISSCFSRQNLCCCFCSCSSRKAGAAVVGQEVVATGAFGLEEIGQGLRRNGKACFVRFCTCFSCCRCRDKDPASKLLKVLFFNSRDRTIKFEFFGQTRPAVAKRSSSRLLFSPTKRIGYHLEKLWW